MSAIEDGIIIDRYIARDEKAISYTADKYGKQLNLIANRIVNDPDTAEECENDTYLRAWNSIPPHEPRTYFFPFLAKITRGIALDRYKESTRQKRNAQVVELTQELSDILSSGEDTSSQVEAEMLRQMINDFLRTLPEEKRNIFLRRYWFMDSIEEIAERFSVSQGKVKTVLFRVRNELQKYLEKEGFHL